MARSSHRSPTNHGWVLFHGVPVNPYSILAIQTFYCSAFQDAVQTRSKYGPTLKAGYVVLPVITSRPLRLPYALHIILAGFIRLEYAYHSKSTMEALGSQVPHYFLSPHADGLTPGSLQVRAPFAFLQTLAFSINVEDQRISQSIDQVYPTVRLSQLLPSDVILRSCTIRFMLRPATLDSPPDWVEQDK